MSRVVAPLALAALLSSMLVFVTALPAAAQPLPAVTINPSATQGLVGAPVSVTVTFDNTGDQPGFGPYVDLRLPAAGADGDDGLTFGSATFLGASVSSTVIDCPAGGGTVTHPLTDQPVDCPDGVQLAVLQVPLGSFTPAQPAATLDVQLNASPLADIDQTLTYTATPGFAFGDTANGTTPIVGSETTATYQPVPLLFHKGYTGPEDETATGPNFPRTYRLTADVPEGQTLTDVTVQDLLPPQLAFLAVTSVQPASGVIDTQPPAGVPSNAPDNELSVSFPSVTGGAGSEDIVVEFSFFVPDTDANGAPVLDPSSGAEVGVRDDGSITGTFDPEDPRDPTTDFTINPNDTSIDDHVLTARSIAIQKTAQPLTTDGSLGPGDVVEYTLRMQVSDFFSMDPVQVVDVLGDGLDPIIGSGQVSLSEHGTDFSGPTAGNETIDDSQHTCGDGTTSITFNVSDALVAAGAADGRVDGGRVGGTFPPTEMTVTFQARVLNDYRCPPPGGDAALDPGDPVANSVTVEGSVIDQTTGTPTGATASDGSSSQLAVDEPIVTKEVYARNGRPIPRGAPAPSFAPGDDITFRLTFPQGSSDMENLTFTDFFPLPVVRVTSSPTFEESKCGVPAPSTVCLGPDDSLHAIPGAPNPVLVSDAAANSVTGTYGTFDIPANPATLIDLLFTVTLQDQPFRDQLLLVNQLQAQWQTTAGDSHTSTAVAPFQVNAPALRITKGVVGSTDPNTTFSGGPQHPGGGITFGGPGTSCASSIQGGELNSVNLGGAPDANAANVDAGDTVRFAFVVENTGHGPNGALDTSVTDSIPQGFEIPPGGLNLCVTDGTGATVDTTGDGMFTAAPGTSGPLDGSLSFDDPGPTESPPGAIDPTTPDGTGGRNLVVVSYELQATNDLVTVPTATNTATITNFSATNGGPNYAPVQPAANLTNDAVVTSRAPGVVKTLVGTDQPHSTGANVAVGEIAQYRVDVTVPEGALDDVSLTDTLPAGLAATSIDDITASGALSTSVGGGFAQVETNANAALAAPGNVITFDFGTLTNSDTDDTVDETISITYSAIVLDVTGNQASAALTNSAVLSFDGRSTAPAATTLNVAEPDLTITKTPTPATADAGDTVTYSVQIAHSPASTLDAFDVTVDDLVPAGLTYVPGSLQLVSGVAPTTLSDAAAPALSATYDSLPLGQSSTLQYQVTVPDTVTGLDRFDNTATTTWTSLPAGSNPSSPFNPDGRERTGAGGVDDYTRSSTAELQIGGGGVVKDLNATSEPSTTGANVTIGEVLTYDMRVTVPEGVHTDLAVTDALPPGLQYVSGTAQVLTTAGSGTAPNTLTADFAGTLPTEVVTSGAGDGDDVVVTFPGTTTVTADNDTTNNAFVVRLQAVVLDVPSNVGVAPQTQLADQGTVSESGQPLFVSNVVQNPVVEPKLQVVKTLNPTAAQQGDTVQVTVAVTNIGTSTAFGVDLDDPLPAQYVPGTVVEVSTPPGFTFSQSGATISYQGGDIAAGATVSFVVTVALQPDLPAPDQITNTATASDASTLPGTVPGERTEPAVDGSATLNLVDADLSIVKDDHVTTVSPGESVTYDLTVTNAGGAAATGASITDTLPANTTFVSVGGTGCAVVPPGGPTTTITIAGSIDPGATVTCTLTVQIDNPLPAGTGVFTNTSTVSYDGDNDDPTPANNTSTDTDTKDAAVVPALSVQKNDGVQVRAPGEQYTYTMTVTNAGGVGATNVLVTDTLPVGTDFVACRTPTGTATVACAFDSATRTVTATFSPIAGGGGTAVLEVDVRIVDPVPASVDQVVNTVTIVDDGANGPDDPTDNTDTDTDTVNAAPDMSIVKVAGASDVAPGDTYSYTLTVANIGDQDATGVVVHDTVPPGLTVDCTSVTPAPTACDPATGALQWGPPLSPSGASDPFPAQTTTDLTYDVAVDDPATADQHDFPNTATVADDGANGIDATPGNNSSSAATSLILGPGGAQPDLAVTKDDGITQVTPGQQTTYQVVVTNNGNIGASNVLVTDTLPPNTTFVSCTTTPAVACTASAGVVTATFPVVAGAGGQATLAITASIDNPQPAGVEQVTNSVTVADDGTNGPDLNPNDNSDTDTDDLTAAPDLDITKNDGVQARTPGEQYTYTLTVHNKGNQDATGVVVTDTLPPGTTFVSCTGGCDASAAPTITWDVGALAGGGATAVVTVTVQVDAPPAAGVETLRNTARVADDGTNGPDPTPLDNADSDTDTLNAAPDLRVTKNDGVLVARPGQTLTYAITAQNVGNQDAAGVVVTDTLPANVAFVSCTPACDSSALPAVTWSLGTLAPGANLPLQVVVTVDANLPASVIQLTNTVTIADDGTSGPDPTPADNTDQDIDGLLARPDLTITKDDGLDRVEGGDTVTYTLVASNVGQQDATGVVVTDTLPPGMTFVSCTAGCDSSAAPVLTWAVGNLASGASVTLAVTVTVDDPVAAGTTEYVNTATVADDHTDGPDLTPGNNTATDRDTYGADLAVTKDDGVTTVTAGEQTTYTITVTNEGPSTVDQFTLTDAAPATLTGLTFTPSAGTFDATSGAWTGLALAPGDSVTMTLTATVDPAATGSLTNTVTVALPAGFTDPTPENNTASDTDTITTVSAVTIDKSGPETASQGDQVTYTIVVTNDGPSDATDVVVTDTPPDTIHYDSANAPGWTCTGGTTVTCDKADPLPAHEQSSLALTFTVVVDNATITNVAEVKTSDCDCDTDDAVTRVEATAVSPSSLPFTGGDVARVALVVIPLAGLGVALVLITRRRRRPANPS